MTEKHKFFSIVTVTLNNLSGLKKTHNSLKTQKSRDFEWIIIDGASTDGTAEYLKKIKADWISEPDNGIYDAMNKGIEKASGHYILFLNAGDQLAHENTLQNLKTHIADQDFIYGDALESQNSIARHKPARSHKLLKSGMFTHHQAMIYKRAALGDIRYNAKYKISGDYDLTVRLLQKTDNVLYLPTPICIFESGGISQSQATLGRKEQFEVRKNLGLMSPLTNRAIYSTQAIIWTFRTLFPNLYWHLKSSGNSAGESAQTLSQQPHPKTPV